MAGDLRRTGRPAAPQLLAGKPGHSPGRRGDGRGSVPPRRLPGDQGGGLQQAGRRRGVPQAVFWGQGGRLSGGTSLSPPLGQPDSPPDPETGVGCTLGARREEGEAPQRRSRGARGTRTLQASVEASLWGEHEGKLRLEPQATPLSPPHPAVTHRRTQPPSGPRQAAGQVRPPPVRG